MKNNKLITVILAALVLVGFYKIGDDLIRFGDGTNSDKTIEANTGQGAANPKIKLDSTPGKWQFTNDGTNFKEIGSGAGGGGGINLIEDGDFEGSLAKWTASTPADFTQTSTAGLVGYGEKSAAYDSSVAGSVVSDGYVVPSILEGVLCTGEMWYLGGDANYTLEVLDGSNAVIKSVPLVTAAKYSLAHVNFICPTADSVKFRISASADGAVIYFDQVHVGTKTSGVSSAGGWKVYDETQVTITSPLTGFVVSQANFVPYKDPVTGRWKLSFNFEGTYTTVNTTSTQFIIGGVTFFAGSNQSIDADLATGTTGRSEHVIRSLALSNSSNIQLNMDGISSTDVIRASGDVALASKPTWADFDGTVNLLNSSVVGSNGKASFYRDGATTLTTIDGKANSIPYNSTTFNVDGIATLDPTGYVTINEDGFYNITAQRGATAIFNSATYLQIYVDTNLIVKSPNSHTSASRVSVSSGPTFISAGQRVTIQAIAIGAVNTVQTSAAETFLTIERVADVTSESAFGFGLADSENAGLVKKNKWQRKYLSSSNTSPGVMSDLTFNNLVVGKLYRVSARFEIRTDDSLNDDSVTVTGKNGATTKWSYAVITRSSTTSTVISYSSGVDTFVATDTSITFTSASTSANGYVQGGTDRSWVVLEELANYDDETTDFD